MSKWPMVALGDVLTLINGRAYKQDEHLESGTPVIRIQNLNGGKRWIYSDLKLADNKYCVAGDLLFAWSASFGPYIWDGPKAIYHYHIWKVIPSPRLDRQFAFYLLEHITQSVKESGRGISMIHVTKSGMEKWKIPLPPLEEQKRIASILDKADAVRRKRRDALALLDTLTQSIFVEMFGDGRTVEKIPLNQIAELINGDRSAEYPSGDDLIDEGVLFLSTKNIRDWQLDLTKKQFISNEKFAKLSRGKLQENDIVITLRGTLGQAAIFNGIYKTGFINAQMMIIRVADKVMPTYLLDLLSMKRTHDALTRGQSGSAVKQLTAAQVGAFEIELPPRSLQVEYIARSNAVRLERQRQRESLDHHDTLFTSLQSRAFNGEL